MIFIGTAGYSYQDWIGSVYPPGTDKKDMLGLYARKFRFTEVNSTFYRMPSPYMFFNMARKVPEGFIFAVKAYKGITHQPEISEAEASSMAADFAESLKPLADARRLGPLLLQFPWSFKPDDQAYRKLESLGRAFKGFHVVAEFRNSSWVSENTFEFLRSQNLGFVCVDEPRLKGLMPPVTVATSSTAYIRFHGRNYAAWWHHKEPYERYDYLYSKEELEEWVPKVKQLNESANQVFVSFNNHYQGKAAVNAQMFQEILS